MSGKHLEIKRVKKEAGESGHAILEFALSLLFLSTLTMGVIDFGNVLNDYSALTEAVHQGARYGSGNLYFENESPISNLTSDQQGCAVSAVTRVASGSRGEQAAHQELHDRVSEVLDMSATQLKTDSLCVTSQLDENGGDKDIVVSVQVAYRSMLFGDLPISVQARAPFLHN